VPDPYRISLKPVGRTHAETTRRKLAFSLTWYFKILEALSANHNLYTRIQRKEKHQKIVPPPKAKNSNNASTDDLLHLHLVV
jgi:hypothetical protein